MITFVPNLHFTAILVLGQVALRINAALVQGPRSKLSKTAQRPYDRAVQSDTVRALTTR